MRSFSYLAISVFLLFALKSNVHAQVAKEYAVELSVVKQQFHPPDPLKITVQWKPIEAASLYTVRRREYGETKWGPENMVEPPKTEFVDNDVERGKLYEYRVGALTSKTTYGFITSGIEVPARATEGTLLLLVGQTASTTCAAALETYIQDLVLLGWNVKMEVISESATVQEVKGKILEIHSGLGDDLRAVFLFGRIPIPYSGNLAPDGHTEDHLGAWPADGYYGDIDGTWTDLNVNSTSATRPENKNIPGDGKFDQNNFPGKIELQVGRVDMRNMGWFYIDAPSPEAREALLLNNYLDKVHKWRTGKLTTNNKSVISDVIGSLGTNDVPAAIAWRAFPVLTDEVNATTNWMDDLQTPHLWAYGAGFGDYFVAQGVGTTEDYSKRDPKAVFTMLFGSRFGDWNSNDNLLRAPLGTSTGLTSMWAGRPYWYVHQMDMGLTIGEATRQSQSASASYIPTFGEGNVEMSLMGDPTLKNHEVSVPLMGGGQISNGTLFWDVAGPEVGFFVSRGPTPKGPFHPLNTKIEEITGENFTDPAPDANEPYYLVRPVFINLGNGSGSFYESGRGALYSPFESVRDRDATMKMLSINGNIISSNAQGTLTIVDVLGRTVAERTIGIGESHDVTVLNAGTYIAQLRTSKGIETLRFNR